MPHGFANGTESIIPALTRLCHAILFIVLNVALLIAGFDADYCATEEFAKGPFVSNVWFYVVAMQARKFMFFIPWCFTDAALIACGLAFKDGGEK